MHISLVGYMASGKTTIGALLATKINTNFVDLDASIAQSEGNEVTEIIRNRGELYFRKSERNALLELISDEGVLSTGGGTPCYFDNMDVLLNESYVVYLQWNNRTLTDRLKAMRRNRPLLDGVKDESLPEFVAKHVFDRRPYYERADQIVYCDGKSPKQICTEILDKWKRE